MSKTRSLIIATFSAFIFLSSLFFITQGIKLFSNSDLAYAAIKTNVGNSCSANNMGPCNVGQACNQFVGSVCYNCPDCQSGFGANWSYCLGSNLMNNSNCFLNGNSGICMGGNCTPAKKCGGKPFVPATPTQECCGDSSSPNSKPFDPKIGEKCCPADNNDPAKATVVNVCTGCQTCVDQDTTYTTLISPARTNAHEWYCGTPYSPKKGTCIDACQGCEQCKEKDPNDISKGVWCDPDYTKTQFIAQHAKLWPKDPVAPDKSITCNCTDDYWQESGGTDMRGCINYPVGLYTGSTPPLNCPGNASLDPTWEKDECICHGPGRCDIVSKDSNGLPWHICAPPGTSSCEDINLDAAPWTGGWTYDCGSQACCKNMKIFSYCGGPNDKFCIHGVPYQDGGTKCTSSSTGILYDSCDEDKYKGGGSGGGGDGNQVQCAADGSCAPGGGGASCSTDAGAPKCADLPLGCNVAKQCIPGGGGASCSTGADCESLQSYCTNEQTCRPGTSGTSCTKTEDCQFTCDSSKQCVSGGAIGTACSTATALADCKRTCDVLTEKCVSGGTGPDCTGDEQCKLGCSGQQCIIGGTGPACTALNAGTVCKFGCSGDKCIYGGTGGSCTSLTDSTSCRLGCNAQKMCVKGGGGASCTVATQTKDCNLSCSSQKTCIYGGGGVACTPGGTECASPTLVAKCVGDQCIPGGTGTKTCDLNNGNGDCYSWPLETRCTSFGTCVSSPYSDGSNCVVGNNSKCTHCDYDTNQCVAGLSDGTNCAAGTADPKCAQDAPISTACNPEGICVPSDFSDGSNCMIGDDSPCVHCEWDSSNIDDYKKCVNGYYGGDCSLGDDSTCQEPPTETTCDVYGQCIPSDSSDGSNCTIGDDSTCTYCDPNTSTCLPGPYDGSGCALDDSCTPPTGVACNIFGQCERSEFSDNPTECTEGDTEGCVPFYDNKPPYAWNLRVTPGGYCQIDDAPASATFSWTYGDDDDPSDYQTQYEMQISINDGTNFEDGMVYDTGIVELDPRAVAGTAEATQSRQIPVTIDSSNPATDCSNPLNYNADGSCGMVINYGEPYYWRVMVWEDSNANPNYSDWSYYIDSHTFLPLCNPITNECHNAYDDSIQPNNGYPDYADDKDGDEYTYTYIYEHPSPNVKYAPQDNSMPGKKAIFTDTSTCYNNALEQYFCDTLTPDTCTAALDNNKDGLNDCYSWWFNIPSDRDAGLYIAGHPADSTANPDSAGKITSTYTYPVATTYKTALQICDDIKCCAIPKDIPVGTSKANTVPQWWEISPY